MIQQLESRQMLAGDLPLDQGPNNFGTIGAEIAFEQETIGTVGANDQFGTAQRLNLGTAPGQTEAFDVTGNLSIQQSTIGSPTFIADTDFYVVSLRAGDILDIAVQNAATQITVFYGNPSAELAGDPITRPDLQPGTLFFGTDTNQGAFEVGGVVNDFFYPAGSPLQIAGNAVAAQVVPATRDYFIQVTGGLNEGAYNLGLRAYRPVTEQLPAGQVQQIFLDLNGGTINSTEFGGVIPGDLIRVDSFGQTLADLDPTFQTATGQINIPAVQAVQNQLVQEVKDIFDRVGDATINENFAFEIITSDPVTLLDPEGPVIETDPFGENDPNSLHVLVGGTAFAPPTIGESQSLDIGNFVLNERVYASLDLLFATAAVVPLSTNVSQIDAFVTLSALVVAHEISHALGQRHTDPFNNIDNAADPFIGPDSVGQGPDGIFGTDDDTPIQFLNERFSPLEGFFGVQQLVDTLGFALSGQLPDVPPVGGGGGGVVGGGGGPAAGPITIGGTVFSDANDNQVIDAGEGGVANAFVFVDLDNDNQPDLGEPSAITDASGSYSITLTNPGSFNVRVNEIPGFDVNFPLDQEQEVVFDGFTAVGPDAQNGQFNFGLLPSQDFGDAPASFGTLTTSHGLIDGLQLGSLIDPEAVGFPTFDASGDDSNNLDDEDGVTLVTPLAPGQAAGLQIQVLNNTANNAYLQGFFDLNGDGDFGDAGERVIANQLITPSIFGTVLTPTITLPANTQIGTINARFRLAPVQNVAPTGFVNGGEVEDYQFAVDANVDLAADDFGLEVGSNSVNSVLPVLANDFVTPTNNLTIVGIEPSASTVGQVSIAPGGQSILYTPPLSFVGQDTFDYLVQDAVGNTGRATVTVNVLFQQDNPVAIDDIFVIPDNSTDRPLNVLENDLAGQNGSITITSVSAGDNGGTIDIDLNGQTLIYTPQIGGTGFEQFTYTITDANGVSSTAEVTVRNSTGSEVDDQIEFSLQLLDVVNQSPLQSVQVGDDFLLEVRVRDIDSAVGNGVASAFLDVLYTAGLVEVAGQGGVNGGQPDIEFGQFFDGDIDFDPNSPIADPAFQTFDVGTPGIINEVGGVQDLLNIVEETDLPLGQDDFRLFTIRLTARTPGVAVFSADPADAIVSESILIDNDAITPPFRQRLGSAELVILDDSGLASSAIDDSFVGALTATGTPTIPGNPIVGPVLDSNGVPITFNSTAILDVLGNDNLAAGSVIQEFGLSSVSSQFSDISIDRNNTPTDFSDDVIEYRRLPGSSGLDTFSYFIVTSDGVFSTAEVTVGLDIQDPIVALDFVLQDSGNDGVVSVGETFGVQVFAQDLTGSFFDELGVFAAFQDVLYSSDLLDVSRTTPGASNASFDVVFTEPFNDEGNFPGAGGDVVDGSSASGTAIRDGLIDEFGAFNGDNADLEGRQLIATLFFTATAAGTASIIGSPADAFPQQDTLVRSLDTAVPVSAILYDNLTFQITPTGTATTTTSAAPLQNPVTIQDVNDDGNVTPLDALVVINQIRRASILGEGEAVTAATASSTSASSSSNILYVDVNGDQRVTALDALLVINYLRSESVLATQIGEGEFIDAEAASGSIAVDSLTVAQRPSEQTDQVIADFSTIDNGAVRTGFTVVDEIADEDDDLFSLLAADQISV